MKKASLRSAADCEPDTENSCKETKDFSPPLDPPAPPLQCGGVMTGKIKGGNRGMGGIWPGSWALCCLVSLMEIKAGCL